MKDQIYRLLVVLGITMIPMNVASWCEDQTALCQSVEATLYSQACSMNQAGTKCCIEKTWYYTCPSGSQHYVTHRTIKDGIACNINGGGFSCLILD